MATRTPLPPLMTRHLHAQIDEIWATRPSPALPPIVSAASYSILAAIQLLLGLQSLLISAALIAVSVAVGLRVGRWRFKRWQAQLPPPEHRIVIMIDRYLEAQRSAAPFN
jgi:hypothetical protein